MKGLNLNNMFVTEISLKSIGNYEDLKSKFFSFLIIWIIPQNSSYSRMNFFHNYLRYALNFNR